MSNVRKKDGERMGVCFIFLHHCIVLQLCICLLFIVLFSFSPYPKVAGNVKENGEVIGKRGNCIGFY